MKERHGRLDAVVANAGIGTHAPALLPPGGTVVSVGSTASVRPPRGMGNPTGRIAEPREMGRTAVFLSGEASGFITGVGLFAGGGTAQV